MNRELQCQYHDNFPIIFINLMKDSDRILKCAKCVSSLKQEVNCLYIQDIKNCNEHSYYENWPPISDESLRQKILQLKDQNINAESKIIDYFDQLSSEIVKILAEKKKKSLIELQQIKDYKNQIIEQYCNMSYLIKMKDCINQEEKSIEEIEKEIKQQINQQYEKVDQHTSILQYMIKKYEFISQFNQTDLSYINDTLKEIFEFVSFTPYYLFGSQEEKEIVLYENVQKKEAELQELKLTHQKISQQIQYLIKQFDSLKEGIVKNLTKQLVIDDLIEQQFDLLLNFQNESVEALQNVNLNIFTLFQKFQCHKNQIIQKNKLNECNFSIKLFLQGYMLIPIEKDCLKYINLGINKQGRFWAELNSVSSSSTKFYLNYILDRHKYYTFRIKIEKKSIGEYSFNSIKFGFYSPDFKNKKYDSNDRLLFGYFDIFDIFSDQQRGHIKQNEIFIEIRLSISNNFIQITDFPDYKFKTEIQNIGSLFKNYSYRFYFCLGFQESSQYGYGSCGDKITIIDIQEQDDHSCNWSNKKIKQY
ncbi:hypothetical protein ABPG74_009944 [Tetrahymena malaccensis]